MNVVSMSAWGERRFIEGAKANARLMPSIYPGWQLWVYTDAATPGGDQEELRGLGARVIVEEQRGGIYGMFWRFFAVAEAFRVVVRDADSLIGWRERVAVHAWEQTLAPFHVMRDHRDHLEHPMLGGMWGACNAPLEGIRAMVDQWGRWRRYGEDQEFLAQRVWPLALKVGVIQHEGRASRFGGVPWPRETWGSTFVGKRV